MIHTTFLSPSRQDRANAFVLACFAPAMFFIFALALIFAPQPSLAGYVLVALAGLGAIAAFAHLRRVSGRPINDNVPLEDADASVLRACILIAGQEDAAAAFVRRHGPLTYAMLPELVDCLNRARLEALPQTTAAH